MMRRHVVPLALMLAVLAVPAAQAQGRGQGWSVFGGTPVGSGNTVFHGEVGYPGISAGILSGVSDRADLGARFSFNYGFEGVVQSVIPGIKLQGLAHLNLVKGSRVDVGLYFEPGVFFYFPNVTQIGLLLPVGLALGVPVGSNLVLSGIFEVPLYVNFPTTGGALVGVPLLFGGGLEYFIDRSLAITMDLKMGPTIFSGGGAAFTLNWQVGIAYRF